MLLITGFTVLSAVAEGRQEREWLKAPAKRPAVADWGEQNPLRGEAEEYCRIEPTGSGARAGFLAALSDLFPDRFGWGSTGFIRNSGLHMGTEGECMIEVTYQTGFTFGRRWSVRVDYGKPVVRLVWRRPEIRFWLRASAVEHIYRVLLQREALEAAADPALESLGKLHRTARATQTA